jgi:hypothetical protein
VLFSKKTTILKFIINNHLKLYYCPLLQLFHHITLNRLSKEYLLNLQYGTPDFIKIDVEGYEYQVLQSLHTPISMIAFEFTPTLPHLAIQCIELISSLSPQYVFNFSPEESTQFYFHKFVSKEEFLKWLSNKKYPNVFGDIYCKINT